MAQSLSQNIIHIVFSTKNRRPLLSDQARTRLYPYIANIIREKGSECYRAGGVADHIHLAVRLSKNVAHSKFIGEIKVSTSMWLKEISPELETFGWQDGYGAFSVGKKDLDALISYIDKQEEHHRKTTFQEEFRKFLDQYGIEYDERYVWG